LISNKNEKNENFLPLKNAGLKLWLFFPFLIYFIIQEILPKKKQKENVIERREYVVRETSLP